MNGVTKLSKKQLRSLINEAIRARHPGEPEPFSIKERFGPYDVKDRYDVGLEPEENSMMPHNFEATHREIFNRALDPVVKEYVEGLMDIYDAGFSPEGRAGADAAVVEAAEEMRAELMSVIEKWLDEGADRIA